MVKDSHVTRQDTGLRAVDFGVLHSGYNDETSTSKRSKYIRWSEKDRYNIGKYASVNGPAAAVRKFKQQFPSINESTARTFRKRVESDLKEAKRKGITPSKSLPKFCSKTGRPLLLGDLDAMVQKYILAASNRGAVITRASAVSTAKTLLKKYPNVVGKVDLDSSSWAKSLFLRMGFVQRKCTSAKVDIPEKARREIEYQYHYDIVSKAERYSIPESLIINLDQTPSYLVPCKKHTMAAKGSTNVTIAGASDKRSIAATFAITLSGEFLPMQLIYGGKTEQSLPRYKFPESFSLSVNQKHYSNTTESMKFFNEVVIPYFEAERSSNNLSIDQYALVIMDVFTGQMTSDVLNLLRDNNILVTNVPPNMTKFCQPLDLTVNGFAKRFMARKFNDWYTDQVSAQLDKEGPIAEIDIKLRLSLLKPLHADWITDLYNYMTSEAAKKIIERGWVSAGIRDAKRLGLSKLPSIDPFQEIAPMMEVNVCEPDHRLICNLSEEEKAVGYSRANETDDEDDMECWVPSVKEDRGAFKIFEDFDDEE